MSGHEGYITVGLFPDGTPGELFITMAKEGSTIGGLMDAFGTAVSMSLQYGVPLEDYVRKFSHMRFEPQGFTKNPDIRIAKSLIDYIFRWLGITFLPGYKEASLGMLDEGDTAPGSARGPDDGEGDADTETKPVATMVGGPAAEAGAKRQAVEVESPKSKVEGQEFEQASGETTSSLVPSASPLTTGGNGHTNGHTNGLNTKLLERAGVMLKASVRSSATSGDDDLSARSEMYADFQADAPACDNCGAITVRNGNCYLCSNCGSSMGCS